MPYARLTDRAVLLLNGEDVGSFLQNLVTADMVSIPGDLARPSALLTPQGKILFDFLVSKAAAGYRIECARSLRDALAKRLALYKLRAKLTIEPGDEPVFAVWDLDEPPSGLFADARFGGAPVYRAYGEVRDCGEEASQDDFRAVRIGSGVAEVDTDFAASEMFPHDVLLDQNGGVSFKKGCYVGQEVVSRMQHRGTARRRLMLATGERHLTEGANVTSGEATIGTLLAATGGTGLVVVRTDKFASGLANGLPIAVDGVPVTLTIPAWAGYTLPAGVPAPGDGEVA
ncbi:folate-binding protein [Fulvimarina sp. 2208YS6-2-32]|uniref:Folate-binding protein n=1 Tax=Fulvimarina uroteuthidis TaxID=3098149 RepID=A0ABU5I2F1_9HYPH|nr:folate-binding protein [Fulvimarina sp. 2208YS6-2-32]MDY8109549.1 folate-binding protein [Fulvimarina sp. 2208YS6-2-32]